MQFILLSQDCTVLVTMKLLLLLTIVVLWTRAQGEDNAYMDKVPNSQHVPHPCDDAPGTGRGHLSVLGGGDRNPFYHDFARLGYKWSMELCQMDSDGDGRTNGQELGDPTCVWREGDIPQQADHISHPGVCDPWNSAQCATRNSWLSCDDVSSFHCDAIHDQGVKSLELRFPRQKVPAEDSSYLCYVFDLPTDHPYHLIAYQPLIDNNNVMRHMTAYACDDTVGLTKEPTECSMVPTGCTDIMAMWTSGLTGDCLPKQTGFRFGKGAANRVLIQHYWTNTDHVDHWYDSSGMRLYYTPRLRPNDVATMTIGQSYLEIPPEMPSLTVTGACSSRCTKMYMKGPLHLVAAFNYMRRLGISGEMAVIKNGQVIHNLTSDHPYSFDSPHVVHFETPIEVAPGDEVKITCEFSSTQRNKTTFNGLGLYDESCYGLLTFYPKQNFEGHCIQWKNSDLCLVNDPSFYSSYTAAFNVSIPDTAAVFKKISDNCHVYGPCRAECRQAIADIRRDNPLYGGQMWDYIKTSVWENKDMNFAPILRFLSAIDTCDRPLSQSGNAMSTCPNNQLSTGDGHSANMSASFLQLMKILGNRPLLQNIIFNFNNDNHNDNN